MEKCGKNLLEYMRERNYQVAEDEALEIMGEIFKGFKALIAAGVVHRDVKPHNILFKFGTNIPKIADFGWSTGSSEHGLASNSQAGSPAYMSP